MKTRRYWSLYATVTIGRSSFWFQENPDNRKTRSVAKIDLNGLKGSGCEFLIIRPSKTCVSHDTVIERLYEDKGVLNLRPGECLILIRKEKYMRIFNLLNGGKFSLTFDNIPGKFIKPDIMRLMTESAAWYEEQRSSPKATQAGPGTRGGHTSDTDDTNPPLWRRIISSVIGGDRSMFSEKG